MSGREGSVWVEGDQFCYIDADGDKQCASLSTVDSLLTEHSDQIEELQDTTQNEDTRSMTVPMSNIPSGNYIDQLFLLPANHILRLRVASVFPTEDDSGQDTTTCIKLIEAPGESGESELYSLCDPSYESGNLLEVSSTSSDRTMAFRVENTDTSNAVRASASVEYVIEEE